MRINSIIKKMNEYFTSSAVNVRNLEHPLATGNCGNFAIAFSKFLSKKKVDHAICVMLELFNEEYGFNVDVDELMEEGITCPHMVIVIDNKIIDYQGVNNFTIMNKLSAEWNMGLTLHEVDKNHPNLKKYVEYGTCPSISSDIFYEYLNELDHD